MARSHDRRVKITRIVTRRLLPTFAALGFASCAFDNNPLARHDMDGDGAISHSEYQQNHMQYNMASRQRADQYNRARLATNHMGNAGDFIGDSNRVMKALEDSGDGIRPKAVPDPKELKHPAKGL